MNTARVELAQSFGTDLSDRSRAAILRERVVQVSATSQEPFVIDFAGVRTVSDSFADELFGVLYLEHGPDWIRQHISAINLAPDVRLTILEAIQGRIDREHAEPAAC